MIHFNYLYLSPSGKETMRATCAVAAARVCCLILFLIMSKTVESFESNLEHNRNTMSSSHTREMVFTEVDDDDVDDDYSQDDGLKKLEFMDEDDGDDGMERLGLTDEYDDDDDSFDHAYAFLNEEDDGTIQEDGEPSKNYMKELLKDEKREDKKKKNGKPLITCSSALWWSSSFIFTCLEPAQAYFLRRRILRHRILGHRIWLRHRTIYHGTRIALQQKSSSRYWMDCASSSGQLCQRSTCPGLYFDSSDTSRCSRLFFRIYRHRGKGPVKNGDIVALHNPTRNQWFGCCGGYCRRASCPGRSAPRLDSRIGRSGFVAMEKSSGFMSATENLELILWTMIKWVFITYREKDGFKEMVAGSTRSTCMGTFRPPLNSMFGKCYQINVCNPQTLEELLLVLIWTFFIGLQKCHFISAIACLMHSFCCIDWFSCLLL